MSNQTGKGKWAIFRGTFGRGYVLVPWRVNYYHQLVQLLSQSRFLPSTATSNLGINSGLLSVTDGAGAKSMVTRPLRANWLRDDRWYGSTKSSGSNWIYLVYMRFKQQKHERTGQILILVRICTLGLALSDDAIMVKIKKAKRKTPKNTQKKMPQN